MTRPDLPIPHPFWIETFTGEAFDLMTPTPDRFHRDDVAVHLSLINRFNGATGEGYSVAQHCVHVAELVPWEFKRRALFHDVEEAYLGDMTSPWKRLLAQHTGIVKFYVDLIRRAASKAFEIDFPFNTPEVVNADLAMLAAETRDFMHARRAPAQPWPPGALPPCTHIPKLEAWPAAVARRRFLEAEQATRKVETP